MKLKWSPPFDSGGCRIEKYEIYYNEIVPKVEQSAGKQTFIERRNLVCVNGEQNEVVIKNLRGNTKYKSFTLTATNKAGNKSLDVEILEITTLGKPRIS